MAPRPRPMAAPNHAIRYLWEERRVVPRGRADRDTGPRSVGLRERRRLPPGGPPGHLGRRGHRAGFEGADPAAGARRGGPGLRSDRERLLDILEAVDRIEAQAARGRAAFAGDELTWRQMV